jgi:glycosyltransferase 2 family protein
MKRVPPAVWFICRLITAVLLCVLLARSFDLSMLLEQVRTIDRGWLIVCVAVPILGILISALRWQVVLDMLAVRRLYGELLLRYWSGAFYNNALPGSIGGDVIRVGGLVRAGVPLAPSTLSVLADRAIGLWAGLLLGLLSCLWPSSIPYRGMLGLIFGCIVIGAALCVWLIPLARRYLPARLERFVALAGLLGMSRRWYVFGLACGFQALVVLHLYVAARALHTPIPLLICGVYAPAVVLTTLLPISLNGIGVREATLVVLLAGVGVPRETAALMGVLIYVTTVLASLPGGLATLALPVKAHNDSSPSPL